MLIENVSRAHSTMHASCVRVSLDARVAFAYACERPSSIYRDLTAAVRLAGRVRIILDDGGYARTRTVYPVYFAYTRIDARDGPSAEDRREGPWKLNIARRRWPEKRKKKKRERETPRLRKISPLAFSRVLSPTLLLYFRISRSHGFARS